MDPKAILATALAREEISPIEALLLLQEGRSVHAELLEAADGIAQRLHGGNATFVRAKQVHYTNVCRADCRFCSFARKKDAKDAFTLRVADVLRQLRDPGLRQVNLQGGLNPDLTVPWHLELLRAVKTEYPNLHIHGYSPAEVWFIARRARLNVTDLLRRMREAGLDSMSGDSAEILNDKVRKKICGDKLRTVDWVETVKAAHRLGIPTTATMLFGHVEDEIQISEHLDIVKHVQKETGGITAFEPIVFVPDGSPMARDRRCRRRQMDLDAVLRVVAISRIFLARSIRHVQIDWTKIGLASASACLTAGADDIGPVAFDVHEIRSAETNGRLSVPATMLRSAIHKAGKSSVERDPWTWRSLPPKPRRVEEPVLV